MALFNLQSQTTTLQGFQLTSESDMFTALQWFSTHSYLGSLTLYYDNGTAKFSLAFSPVASPSSAQSTVFIGDWIIIKNGVNASACTAANFSSLYTVV